MPIPPLPNIDELLGARQDRTLEELRRARRIILHPTEKGDRSEEIWRDTLRAYLPSRYDVRKAFVVDSEGSYSEQIDLVVHDRFYSPLVFTFGAYEIVPIEAVYAAFEIKQAVRKSNLEAAMQKIASVRCLVPKLAATEQVPNPSPSKILGGLLATQSESRTILSPEGAADYMKASGNRSLNFICSAEDALLERWDDSGEISVLDRFPAAALPMKLARAMQVTGTVCPIDIDSYLAE